MSVHNASSNDGGISVNTSLAMQRTRFAAERTLMAWVRTAFSMITFGFSLVKFFQYLQSGEHDPSHSGTHYVGLAMILLGIAAIIAGIHEHWSMLVSLNAIDGGKKRTPALFMAIGVGALGIIALVSALVRSHSS
jgi:putative membrane protein